MRETDAFVGDLDHVREDRVTKIRDVELVNRGADHADRRLGECRDGEQRRLHAGAHALQPSRDRVTERGGDRQLAPVLEAAAGELGTKRERIEGGGARAVAYSLDRATR